MKPLLAPLAAACAVLSSCTTPPAADANRFTYQGNPLIRDRHTADPAPLVVGDT